MKKKILLLMPLLMTYLFSFGQFFYTDHSVVESVEISYKWKVVKDGPKELRLKFKNRNHHAVLISLSTDFYMNGFLEESSPLVDFCINNRSMVAGKLDGVIITSSALTNEQLNSEDFEFKINDITVQEIQQSCREWSAEAGEINTQ